MRKEMDLITIILPRGKGNEVLDLAKQKGVIGGFIGVGEGTASKEVVEKLGITDLVRDVVSLVAPTDLAKIILELAAEKFDIGKPNHGIAFSTNVSDVQNESHENDDNESLKVITAIVQKGSAKKAIDFARESGAKGGTLVKHDPKGSGTGMSIEDHSEEDVMVIISESETYKDIMSSIRKATENDDMKSIVYVQNAHFVYGLK